MAWIFGAIPICIIPLILPYVFDRLPPLLFVLLTFPINIGGLMCLLMSGNRVWLKYLSIGLTTAADSITDLTSVSLTAYFDKITVTAYCAGTGIACVFGPLYYIGIIGLQ